MSTRDRMQRAAWIALLGLSSIAAQPTVVQPGFILERYIPSEGAPSGEFTPVIHLRDTDTGTWPNGLYGSNCPPGEEFEVLAHEAGAQRIFTTVDVGDTTQAGRWVGDIRFDTTPGGTCGDFLFLSLSAQEDPLFQGIYRMEPDGDFADGPLPWWSLPNFEYQRFPLEMAFSTPFGPESGDILYVITQGGFIHRRPCAGGESSEFQPTGPESFGPLDHGIMHQDPTGDFGGYLYITTVNGIAWVDPSAGVWDWFVRDTVNPAIHQFTTFAFSTGGAFGRDLYVASRDFGSVKSFGPTATEPGHGELLAHGFDFAPGAISIAFSTDGAKLYVADTNGIWAIRPDGTNLTVDIECCGTFACPGGSVVYQTTADNGTIDQSQVGVIATGVGVPGDLVALWVDTVEAGEEHKWVEQLRLPPGQPSVCPTSLTLTAETTTRDGTVVSTDSCVVEGVLLTE